MRLNTYIEKEVTTTTTIKEPIDFSVIKNHLLSIGKCGIYIDTQKVSKPLYIIEETNDRGVIYYSPYDRDGTLINITWGMFKQELLMNDMTSLYIDILK